MYYVVFVHVVESQKYLLDNVGCLWLLQSFRLFDHPLVQFPALAKLTCKIEVLLIMQHFNRVHDLWVGYLLDDLQMLNHNFLEDFLIHGGLWNSLEGASKSHAYSLRFVND
jgi:hypothetical protein